MFADAIDFPRSGISEFSSKGKIRYHRNSRFMREEQKLPRREGSKICCGIGHMSFPWKWEQETPWKWEKVFSS